MKSSLIILLKDYSEKYPEEINTVEAFNILLENQDAFYRTCRPGHITVSGLILNKQRTEVLLLKHRKLGIWVQPGGHSDGEEDTEKTARREIEEETGLIRLNGGGPVLDLDIHPIPERPGESSHYHYDVRFLFTAQKDAELVISSESTDLKWVKLSELTKYTKDISMLKLIEKAGADYS